MRIDCETLLSAYAQGVFPMGDPDGVVRWYTADPRGILPLDGLKVSRSMRQVLARDLFELRFNHSFEQVMRACARDREEGTWINEQLIEAYSELHRNKLAHSVEAWQGGKLVGGLYGVSMGAAFFGESMFHTVTNASKFALFHLVKRLRDRQYELLDTQAATNHLKSMGAIEMPLKQYLTLLRPALMKHRCFD